MRVASFTTDAASPAPNQARRTARQIFAILRAPDQPAWCEDEPTQAVRDFGVARLRVAALAASLSGSSAGLAILGFSRFFSGRRATASTSSTWSTGMN